MKQENQPGGYRPPAGFLFMRDRFLKGSFFKKGRPEADREGSRFPLQGATDNRPQKRATDKNSHPEKRWLFAV